MVTKITNHPAPQALTAKVSRDAMLTHVITSGKAAHTAALQLAYSATAFILLVNHFTPEDQKGWMGRQAAVDYISKEIADKTGVKGNMLAIYIRNASTLAGILTSSKTLFAPTLQKLAGFTEPQQMVDCISTWFQSCHDDKGLRKKITSLATMSEALGFAISKRGDSGGGKLTASKVPDRIHNTMQQVQKLVGAGSGKVQEKTVAQAVVVEAQKPILYAVEAIKRIYEESELDVLEAEIKKQRKVAKDLAEAADREQKASAKKASQSGQNAAKPKGRSTTKRASA